MGDEISTVPKAGETPGAWLTRTSSAAQPLPVPGLGPDAAPQDPSPKPGERPADWLGRTTAAADPNFEAIAGTGLDIPVDRAARILKAQSRSGYSTEFIDKNLDAVEGDIKRSGFDVERLRAGSPLTAQFLKENPARVGLFAADLRGLTDNEKLLAMAADPDVRLRPFTPKEVQEQAEREVDLDLSDPMTTPLEWRNNPEETRSDMIQRSIDRIRAEEEVIGKSGQIEAGEALSNKARENPAFFLPHFAAVDPLVETLKNRRSADRMKAKIHTPADEERLVRAFRYQLAKSRRGETTGTEAASMVADLPAFIGSLYTSGGVNKSFTALAGGVTEGLATEAGTMAPSFAARAVGVLAQTPFAMGPQTIEHALKLMTPTGQAEPDKDGNFTYQIDDGSGKSAAIAIPQAFISSLVDVGTANVNFNPIYKLWAGKVAAPTAEGFIRDVSKKGIEGVLSFIGVNELAKGLKAAAGIQPYELPTWQNLKAQALVGGTLAVGHRSFERYEAWHSNAKAQATADAIGKVSENVKEMAAAKASPEEIQKAIAAQVKDSGAEHTYLPASDFALHFEQQGVDPHELATELTGDPTALEDALRDGHDLQVPTAAYVARIGATPDGAFFQPKLRLDPAAPNLDESQKHLAELDQAMEAERQAQSEARAAAAEKKAQGAQPAAEEPSMPEQIGKRLREQLEAAGFKAEAKQYQALVESGFKQFAEKAKAAGIDPAEFLKRYTPTVDKGAPPEGEGQYVKVMDQSGTHVQKVAGDTPAEAVLEAHKKWADATIEPMTDEEVRNFLPLAMERHDGAVTLEQPGEGGDPRGQIRIGDSAISISLLEKADPSTFLHETGHLYLEMLGDLAGHEKATDQVKGDFATVLDWLGVKERGEIGRVQHEQFARGFEAYLMKGEAPSAKLRLAFDRFKSWLLEVYKNIRNLDVELSPKVRGVFDRLLASDEEIQSAYESRGRREAFLSAAPDLKMSEADAAKYADLIAQAHEAARSKLDHEALADIREQETEKYQRAREATRKAVEDEVNALPEQVALARLQRHKTPDGKDLPEGTPKLKLDRASIDPEVLKRLPRGVTGQDGLTPDGAAEQLGFPSGEALLSGLQRAVDVEGYGIPSPREVEIRTNLAHLEATRKALEMMREPLEAEAKEATADAMAGKKAIAAELARSMRQEERAKVADLKQMLQDIRDRGGIRPSDPKTEQLPRKFRARGQEGVGSDEAAQELYDRGILKDATSDDLYEWLNMVDAQVQASRDRIKAIAGEANDLAKRKVKEALEAFVENAKQQERLREELDRSAAERRTLEGGILKNPREAIIERTTNERMAQTHPKPVEALDDKALEAIHNDKEAKLKAYEIKWLLENKPNAMKGLLRVVTDPVKYVASVAAYADQKMLGETDRATAAGKYQTGERQARIAAREALLKNDIDGAVGFKQRELLNHELFRAATEMKQDVQKIAKYMRRFGDKDVLAEVGKADPASRDQLIDLMRRFEFSKEGAAKRASKQLLIDFLKDKMVNGVGEQFQTPSFVLDTAFQVNYQDMKYGELLQLRDFAKQIETTADLTNASMHLEKRVTRTVMKREFIEGLAKNAKERGPQATESAMTMVDKMNRLGRQVNVGLIRTEQWVREADAADIMGPVRKYLFNGAVEAQKAELDLQTKVGALVVKAIETLPAELRKGLSERIAMPGRRPITMYDVFGFAAQAGNASNWHKFLEGEQQRNGGHTAAEIVELIKRLTPAHATVIQEGIWDAQETLWPLIDEKHQKWTGLKLPKVEASPQHELFAGMRGGYMPVIYEAGLSKQGQMQEAARVGEFQQDGYHSATIASGYRRARIEEFARPMDTDLRNLPSHVATVIKDLTHREWMVDANFLLNDEEVRHAVTEHYGPEMIKRLEEWVKQTVNSRNQSSTQSVSGLRRVYEGARLNMVSAMMLLKATTLLKHATSSAAAVDMIGNGDLVKGAKYYAMGVEKSLRPRQAYDEMVAKSTEMPHFLENNDREMHENIERLKGKTGQLAKVQMLGSYAVGMMNLSRAMPAWWGEYFRAMDEFPAEKGLSGAELEKYAAMSADEVVRSSVGTSHAKDLSAVMAAKGDLMRAFTLGYTPGMVLYSRLHDVATRFGRDKNVPRLVASLLMTGIVAGTLHEVVGGNFPNTKKDEGWGPWWLKSIGSYFASALPMGRDAVEYLLHGRESSSVNPMVHDAKMISRAVESGAGAFNGDDPEKFIVDSARAAEYFAGLPTDQALTTGEYMYDLQSGKADKPNDLWTFYHDFLHGQHRKK